MIIGTTNLVINEIGAVFNVRIEGDTDANLFCTDATNSRVGVGTVGPTAKLDVVGGDIRIDNGNLIIGTSGKGVDFSITSHPAGMTSELLADYEEGDWTPAQGAGLTVVGTFSSVGRYTKIGRIVTVHFSVSGSTSVAAAVGDFITNNLPFTVAGVKPAGAAVNQAPNASAVVLASGTGVFPAQAIVASNTIFVTITYQV
jgi:hypothetical protein